MTKLTVVVRVRPLSEREIMANAFSIVSVQNKNTIAITNYKVPKQNAGDSRKRIKRFAFDCCFDSNSTQEDVYEYIGKEISTSVKRRFHSCILAYGQSASGKTHTMVGFGENVGIAPRICENILGYLAESAVGSEVDKVNATISYLEIYNEKVRDLLMDTDVSCGRGISLKVREHPKKGPYVQGLSEHSVLNSTDLLNYLQTGNNNRTVGETNANPRSSRSHSIFTITSYDGLKLRLVDLAGSERSGSRSPFTSRFREGANINKSLVSLKNVISALADFGRFPKSRRRYVPYRDSTLTWLLKDTLDGNSNTILISTISPSNSCYNESINTLRFGQTAKKIIVQPIVNEDIKDRTIRELRAEVAKLRELLQTTLGSVRSEEILIAEDFKNKSAEENIFSSEENKLSIVDSDSSASNEICSEEEQIVKNKYSEENGKLHSNPNPQFEYVSYKTLNESSEEVKVVLSDSENQIAAEKILVVDENKNVTNESTKNAFKLLQFLTNLNKTKILTFNGKQRRYSYDDVYNTTLIPIMEASSSENLQKPRPLRRTFSMDHKINEKLSDLQEKPFARKSSIENRVLPKRPPKIEKGTTTEVRGPKIDVKPKIDSHRSVKPRSQIVAAVTQRLYSKIKKKEMSTNTEEIHPTNEVPKELQICSNARTRLQEMTLRALRAHRRRNVETQTELYPVLRVKEISTDVSDLQYDLKEISDAEMNTEMPDTKDIGLDCILLDQFNQEDRYGSTIIFTKTCGTCTEPLETQEPKRISFTKYLEQKPKFEILNPSTANPIYTSAVNININHNYYRNNEVISDDSLEGDLHLPNFPDLLSNHNSLEQNQVIKQDLCSAEIYALSEEVDLAVEFDILDEICKAELKEVPKLRDHHSFIQTTHAPIILVNQFEDDYDELPPPKFYNAQDSLNDYFQEEKNVRFTSEPTPNNIMEVMTNFMKEASTLMTNLSSVARRLEGEQTYDLTFTLNGIHGLPKRKQKPRKKVKRFRDVHFNSSTQTSPVHTYDVSTEIDMPENKYEMLVKESCDRLEKLLECDVREQSPEFSSLESTQVFSDYGSLPRRKYKRTFGCSPSSYLRQLTTMRKNIVQTSRQELLTEAQMHL